jgi:hypothetical protein
MGSGWFHAKVVGVTHDNADGSRRQPIIGQCQVGEPLLLCPEPENQYDPNAVGVCRNNGQQIGYVSSVVAEELHGRLRQGQMLRARIENVTGGGPWRSLGVNILIEWMEPESKAEPVNDLAFLDELSERDIRRVENRKPRFQ